MARAIFSIHLIFLILFSGTFPVSGKDQKNNFRGLAHISIYTRDMNESLKFYTEKLPFKKVYETELDIDQGTIKFTMVRLNSCIIELLEPENHESVQFTQKGNIDHFAIEVKNIKKVVEDLKNKNVEFTSEIFSINNLLNGVNGVFIKGPNGEAIELFEYKNKKLNKLK